VTITGIGIRNIFRNKLRTLLTVLGGAVAVLAFVLVRTTVWASGAAIEFAPKDRLATRHKVSLAMTLPRRYVDSIRQVPGIEQTTWVIWFGGKDPKRPDQFFVTLAIDSESFFEVYPEMVLKPAEKAAWQSDRSGAIVGDVFARRYGVKVGDKVTLTGTHFPGDWEFNIDGIYETTQKAFDRTQFLFHWAYWNERVVERYHDQIGWAVSRVESPLRAAALSAEIDKIFDEKDIQTTTMSERSMNNSIMAAFSAVLSALNIVSLIILAIMALILANTMAMGVRERTREYGVLRALGFSARHIGAFVIGEALAIGVLAGGLGLALSYPVVELGMGRWIEENMGSFLPYFRVTAQTSAIAGGLSVGLAAASALIPAMQASRLKTVDALRSIG
jgi:putative ABC transport system permease protein